MAALAFMFSACNKCVECTNSNYQYTTDEYNEYTGEYEYETYGDQIIEVCSDNFESKDDFNDYIEAIEDEPGVDCKSDFWN
jgi:hypothetical protein